MTYVDKRRDIARSVLPSTRRKAARADKRAVHGRVRARVRDALRDYDDDNLDDVYCDPQRDRPYHGIKEVVRERRAADKTSTLMRWAEAKAADLGDTPAERAAALRAMLPQNLIGWHAMTHVEFLDAYEPNPERYLWRRAHQARPSTWVEDHAALVAALNARLDRHGELNRRLKHTWALGRDGKPIAVRYWAGRHDTDDFARWALHLPRDRHRIDGPGKWQFRWTDIPVGARAVIEAFAAED